jgi:hypothetical protein
MELVSAAKNSALSVTARQKNMLCFVSCRTMDSSVCVCARVRACVKLFNGWKVRHCCPKFVFVWIDGMLLKRSAVSFVR